MYRNLLICRSLITKSVISRRWSSSFNEIYEQITNVNTDYSEFAGENGKYYDKILYSSYLELQRPKRGYVGQKIFEGRQNWTAQKEIYNKTEEKPFPVSLQCIYDEKYEDLEEIAKKEQEAKKKQDEEEDVFILPYSKVVQEPEPTNEEKFPNWMQDYENYEEDEDEQVSFYGTSDPREPISKTPCSGCGALLHCANPSVPGYLPSELYKNRTKNELVMMVCQRCHFLKNYNTAINVTVSPMDYIKMISTIEDKYALAVIMVDLLDFPCSIWPELADILGPKRPIIVVGNKVDLLPKDNRGYLNNIQQCLEEAIINAGFDKINVKHVGLISATTGFGVEELITKLHQIWEYKGDVYIVGCTNVGKSSLFNALLRSDYCKSDASDLVQRATTCPWPGTTLKMLKFPIMRPSHYRVYERTQRLIRERKTRHAEDQLRRIQARDTGKIKYATLIGHIGQTFDPKQKVDDAPKDIFSFSQNKGMEVPVFTLNENHERYLKSKWCYDTPGVVQPEQIINILTTEELLLTIPKEMIRPRAYLLKPGMSFFLAGLGRVDYLEGPESVRVMCYSSTVLPTMICYTKDAEEVYNEFLGTELFLVPKGGKERMEKWPALKADRAFTVKGFDWKKASCDILLSSAGWVSPNLSRGSCGVFQAWTPERRGIYIRTPALLPSGMRLKGARIRRTLAYRVGKAFVTQ